MGIEAKKKEITIQSKNLRSKSEYFLIKNWDLKSAETETEEYIFTEDVYHQVQNLEDYQHKKLKLKTNWETKFSLLNADIINVLSELETVSLNKFKENLYKLTNTYPELINISEQLTKQLFDDRFSTIYMTNGLSYSKEEFIRLLETIESENDAGIYSEIENLKDRILQLSKVKYKTLQYNSLNDRITSFNLSLKIKKLDGIAGQNNPNPVASFALHNIVEIVINNKHYFYDPSYGKKYTNNNKGYNDNEIDKFLLTFQKENIEAFYRPIPDKLIGIPFYNIQINPNPNINKLTSF